jgi:hypothetical protein
LEQDSFTLLTMPVGEEGVATEFMRTLIYIPIIHTQADMGALAGAMRRLAIEKLGRREWERSVKAIDQLWAVIRETIEKLDLPYTRVRLFQDGLPHCGREAQIVTDLANAGSPNHQVLLFLMGKGATLMGTESADLLLEEYQLAQQVLNAQGLGEAERVQARQKSLSQSLLGKRDRYIAERINETLGEAETGLLFVGMLHSLEEHLAKDIQVHYPILRPAQPNSGVLDRGSAGGAAKKRKGL